MNANTCNNTLNLPVSSKYLDYNLLQEEFTTCILDSPGFGNVQLCLYIIKSCDVD